MAATPFPWRRGIDEIIGSGEPRTEREVEAGGPIVCSECQVEDQDLILAAVAHLHAQGELLNVATEVLHMLQRRAIPGMPVESRLNRAVQAARVAQRRAEIVRERLTLGASEPQGV